MRKFLAIWRQDPNVVCDHTIGCGIAIHKFEAVNRATAQQRVINSIAELENDNTADSLSQVDIIEYVAESVTLMPSVWKDERAKRKHEHDACFEAAEKREYERLKRKFDR